MLQLFISTFAFRIAKNVFFYIDYENKSDNVEDQKSTVKFACANMDFVNLFNAGTYILQALIPVLVIYSIHYRNFVYEK